jgi:hypothetical protein
VEHGHCSHADQDEHCYQQREAVALEGIPIRQ